MLSKLVLIPIDVCLWLKPVIGHLVLAAGQWLQLISCGDILHTAGFIAYLQIADEITM